MCGVVVAGNPSRKFLFATEQKSGAKPIQKSEFCDAGDDNNLLRTSPMTTTYAPQQAASGRTVQINNVEMYYEEYGTGKPLVLLHGFGGSAQNWHAFIAKLSERHRLIVVDLRGHGHSTNPENKFTHREAASDVFLLLEKLGANRFSAMGVSSGGMTLLHKITTVPKAKMGAQVGRLDDEDIVRLNQAMTVFLGMAVTPRAGRGQAVMMRDASPTARYDRHS
jgi:predicted alpha/beta-fold hydrolase